MHMTIAVTCTVHSIWHSNMFYRVDFAILSNAANMSILPVLAGDVRAALGLVPFPSSSSRTPKHVSRCPILDAIFSREGCPTSTTFSFRYTPPPRTANRAQDSVPSTRPRRQCQHFRLIPAHFGPKQSKSIARRSAHNLSRLPPQMDAEASSICRSALGVSAARIFKHGVMHV